MNYAFYFLKKSIFFALAYKPFSFLPSALGPPKAEGKTSLDVGNANSGTCFQKLVPKSLIKIFQIPKVYQRSKVQVCLILCNLFEKFKFATFFSKLFQKFKFAKFLANFFKSSSLLHFMQTFPKSSSLQKFSKLFPKVQVWLIFCKLFPKVQVCKIFSKLFPKVHVCLIFCKLFPKSSSLQNC